MHLREENYRDGDNKRGFSITNPTQLFPLFDNGGCPPSAYLTVCLASTLTGAPILGLSGFLFLALCTQTGAPPHLAAAAGLFTAGLAELGWTLALQTDFPLRSGFPLLGVGVYLAGFAHLCTTCGADEDATEVELNLLDRVLGDVDTRRWDRDDTYARLAPTDAQALRDWDSRLSRNTSEDFVE
jgi:hypothetical protein